IPTAHEDDALRAVRAAADMQQELARLNDSLETRFGQRLAIRIGLNTGEVLAGVTSGELIAAGDPVNVGARLQQAARPGDVVLGDETYRLVRSAVRARELEPIAAKGKGQPLRAYGLEFVLAPEPLPAPQDARFVGRTRELNALNRLLDLAFDQQRAISATVVG